MKILKHIFGRLAFVGRRKPSGPCKTDSFVAVEDCGVWCVKRELGGEVYHHATALCPDELHAREMAKALNHHMEHASAKVKAALALKKSA